MAISVALKERLKMGNAFMVVADITLDDSYPTGGEAFDSKSIGLNVIHGMMVYPSGGYLFEYVHSTKKIKAYTPVKVQAAHTHVENAAESYTQSAATAEGGAVTASAASEVVNAVDLNTVVMRVIAIGI